MEVKTSGKPNVTKSDDKEMRSYNMLQSNAINCTRGKAAEAIAQLLWNDKFLFGQFKDTIEKLTLDENPAVRLASLFALWPSYNIERDWASERILNLYEQDYRFAGFHGTKDMFFLIHPKYRERVLNIIIKCYESDDKELVDMGAYSLSEMYIRENEFANIMDNVDIMGEKQAEAVLNMAMIYFNKEEYNPLVKNIMRKFKKSTLDIEMPISRLFYDNLNDERSKDKGVESETNGNVKELFASYFSPKSPDQRHD